MAAERNTAPQVLAGDAEQLRLGRGLLPGVHHEAVVSPSWGRRDRLIRRALAGADIFGLLAGLLVALVVGGNPFRDDLGGPLLLLAVTMPAWLLLFKLYGLYDRDIKRISHSSIDDLAWLFHATLIGGLAFWALVRVMPMPQLSFAEAATFGAASMIAVTMMRMAARDSLRRWMGPERTLFAGTGPLIPSLLRKIHQHPEYGLEPVGLVDSENQLPLAPIAPAELFRKPATLNAEISGPSGDLPVLGALPDLERLVSETRADRLLICRAEFSSEQVMSMIDTCRRYSVKVSIVPDALESLGPSVVVDEVEGVTLLGVNPPVLSRTSRVIKRGFDVLVAASLLLVTAPLVAAIAIAIKLDSAGPVFFRQPRVGRAGNQFEVIKFRTMVVDAEERREELMAQSIDPGWLHLDQDVRVTLVGRALRRASLDELPQMWNVLLGEMSLVGPRPLAPYEDANVGGWARGRLDITPGITGMWQVLGRTRIPFDEMVKLDYMYVTNWTLWMDVRILVRTLPAVLRGHGSN